MPATQRMLNHRATTQVQSPYNNNGLKNGSHSQTHGASNTFSYSAGNNISSMTPVVNGSRAAQFL